jgi:hypothetical protein
MARRRRWPSILVAGGTGRRENQSGITAAEWGPDLRGRGRRGAHRSSAPHGGAVGGGGSPVRGRWRGRGRSLCGRRGAPGRGDACGGGDEAGGGLERPAHGGVPGEEKEGGLSGGGGRRLWLGHTSRKSAEWSERCAGPMRSSWRLKRGRSRGVLSPMVGGVGGRRCARTERAEANESVGVKVLN